mmetsp:Transcript_34339/g.42296  ORF Transcript_34339/g.42296 Transcript_34339/m.42296 type:complete len:125 (+) Transcript_34339:71-445(+)
MATSLVRVLLCSLVLMPSLAQNLKGSVDVTSVSDANQDGQMKSEVTDSKVDNSVSSVSMHEDLPKKHPPTTNQALVSMLLIFIIPAAGLFIMYKGKNAGWEGAFGLICCLITCVWIYTAVLAFM